MECSKIYQVTISEAVAVLFTWGAATLDDGGGTTLPAFSPDGADGNTAISTADTNGTTNNCTAENSGQITFNSTAVLPCNLHVVTTTVGSNPDPTIVSGISIGVVVPVVMPILFINAGIDYGFNDDINFPFNLPDTGGADWTIVWFQTTAVSPLTNPGSMTTTAEFTVV